MIDYIKIALKCVIYAEYLRTHRLLKGSREIKDTETGTTVVTANYNGLSFVIHPTGYVVIDGSLHKYFNGGEHNHNDFSMQDLQSTLDELASLFGEKILSGTILNLEYGLNVYTPFNPVDFTNNILTYIKQGVELRGRQKAPITKDDRKGFDKGIKFMLSQYHIKIYDKGSQYKIGKSLLRLELKTIKTEIISDANIKTLQDLTDISKLSVLHAKLMHTLNFVLVREVMDSKQLTNNERAIWQECINPDNWIYLWNNDKRQKRKSQYARIINKYALSDMKSIVIDLLESKFKELNRIKKYPFLDRGINSKVSVY